MLSFLWFTFLYQPLFSVLIWLYSGIADHNLGWAVIWLTILLRVVMLPLTIISEFTNVRRKKAIAEATKALQAYKGDRVAQKEEARKIMRRYRISPWAKVLMLGIQLLVLVLLYQVFIQGISGLKITKLLYAGIDFPGLINTKFYGFEIGKVHDSLWAGIAAAYLLIAIYIEERTSKWGKSKMFYLIAFPAFTFFALWYLPMVKSLFILTTMIFTDIITIIRKMFEFMLKKPAKPAA